MDLKTKMPESPENQARLQKEMANYATVISYIAQYVETRARMGDMTTREVMDEIEANVCIVMRQGFDILGTH